MFHNATVQNANVIACQIAAEGQRISAQISHTMPMAALALERGFERMNNSFHQSIQAVEASVSSAIQETQRLSYAHDNRSDRPNSRENQHTLAGQARETSLHSQVESVRTIAQPLQSYNDTPVQQGYPGDHEESLGHGSEEFDMHSLFESKCSCYHQPLQGGLGTSKRGRYRGCYHKSSCPLSITEKVEYDIVGRFKLFNYLFICRMGISYSRHAAFRSLQIQPNFTVRAVVPGNSPAFVLVRNTMIALESCETPDTAISTVGSCLVGLEKLFLQGKAWPTDTTHHYGNLLDVIDPI